MKFDTLVVGVGGQGVISVCAVIARAAMDAGLKALQTESHGMAQRGGGVVSHLRLSDCSIHSPLVGRGQADLVFGLELLETCRYMSFLSMKGRVITSKTMIQSLDDYPSEKQLMERLGRGNPVLCADVLSCGKKNRITHAANMILLGVASAYLPIGLTSLENAIPRVFKEKGDRTIENNLKAFSIGANGLSSDFVIEIGPTSTGTVTK
jgi:indolepyruvate ferredoxin oxidoreductase beta subunit